MTKRMKHVILTARVDDETGELGLVADGLAVEGMPSVATEGLQIAHDLIEHQNGIAAIGGIDDELEALGALWYVRGQFGSLRRDGRGSAYTVHQNIAADVANMFTDSLNGSYVAPALRTRIHGDDDDFRKILKEAREIIESEAKYDDRVTRRNTDEFLRAACSRLRIGYRKAARRFGSAIAAHDLFWRIADAVQPYARNCEIEGQQFLLSYNGERAYCEEFYGEEV